MVILENEVLEGPAPFTENGWVQQDVRLILRVALRVSDLDAAIRFYNRYFGLQLLRKLDFPGQPIQRALMVADTSSSTQPFALELRCSDPDPSLAPSPAPSSLRVGDTLQHFTLVVPSAPAVVEALRLEGRGDRVVQELAAVIPITSKGGSKQDTVSLVRDLDGYPWQLLELHRSHARERLCTLALAVRDLGASLGWYQAVLGMRVLQKYESTGPGHQSALVGFTPELEGALLELRQGGDPPPRDPGNALGWLVVGTRDLNRTMVQLEGLGQAWEKVDLPSCAVPTESIPAAAVTDPDGWRFCLVQLGQEGAS